jgi:hypothetical protein
MSKKKWISCGDCVYLPACKCGQTRLENVDTNSKIYSDIGCFEHEQHLSNKQLKLFKD